jgi:hypothetical protein
MITSFVLLLERDDAFPLLLPPPPLTTNISFITTFTLLTTTYSRYLTFRNTPFSDLLSAHVLRYQLFHDYSLVASQMRPFLRPFVTGPWWAGLDWLAWHHRNKVFVTKLSPTLLARREVRTSQVMLSEALPFQRLLRFLECAPDFTHWACVKPVLVATDCHDRDFASDHASPPTWS